MDNKIFVGSLAWATDDAGLRKAFEQFGEIESANVITDRQSGRSRGFGFVTFKDAKSAEEAMSLDQSELDGRKIIVSKARN